MYKELFYLKRGKELPKTMRNEFHIKDTDMVRMCVTLEAQPDNR